MFCKRKAKNMKDFKRIIAGILASVTVLSVLASCDNGKGPSETTDDPQNQPDQTTEPIVTTEEVLPIIGDNFVTVFSEGKLNFSAIKYKVNPGDVEFNAIKKLRDRINKETEYSIKCSPDYSTDSNPADPSTYEILIGQTNYSESKEVLSSLAKGDYAIKVVGNKLVINAHDESEINRAINYILNTMFESTITEVDGNKTILISEYNFVSEKPLADVLISGNSLKDYAIVYSSDVDKNSILPTAQHLWSTLSGKTGITTDLVSDKETTSKKYKIVLGVNLPEVGKTVESMSYVAKIKDGNYYISAGGLLSLHMAVNDVISTYVNGRPVDKKVSLEETEKSLLKVKEQPLTAGAEFRVMTYNIMAQWTNWGGDYMPVSKRYEAFKSIIDVYSPDVIGLQEVSEHWSVKIDNELKDYAFVNRITPDGKFINLSTIIYKKDKLEVVDQGLQYFSYNGPNQIRLVNWAIFKDKATGKQFAFFNTHWMFVEGNDAERKSHAAENAVIINQVMAAHPNVKHVFSTADYNTTLGHTYFNDTFLKNANLVNTLDIAKKAGTLINEVGGCGTLGVSRENNTGGGSIDNIFSSNNMDVLRHETILWSGVEHVSDHSPKYADIVLK